MEIARHTYYVFDHDEQKSLLSFLWTDRTASMTDEDYKAALRHYARLLGTHRVRRGLIDLRKFHHHPGPDLMAWRKEEIVPAYHAAGLQRFAYVLPEGVPAPPADAPGIAEPGERFLTKRFGSHDAALAWVTESANQAMELVRHRFYAFDLDQGASLLSFNWTEESAAMTAADYMNAIRDYARLVVQHRTRRALIDLRSFCYRLRDGDVPSTWWAEEIVPLYNKAGLERFAFLLPAGAPAPPEDAPTQPAEGQRFVTRHFGSKQAAIAWLTGSA